MNELKTNKNSATEDDIGRLHKIVTVGYTKLISSMISNYEQAIATGNIEEAQFIFDSSDLNAAAKWVTGNGMGSLPADEVEGSEAAKELREIQTRHRNNVIAFQEAANG